MASIGWDVTGNWVAFCSEPSELDAWVVDQTSHLLEVGLLGADDADDAAARFRDIAGPVVAEVPLASGMLLEEGSWRPLAAMSILVMSDDVVSPFNPVAAAAAETADLSRPQAGPPAVELVDVASGPAVRVVRTLLDEPDADDPERAELHGELTYLVFPRALTGERLGLEVTVVWWDMPKTQIVLDASDEMLENVEIMERKARKTFWRR